MTRPTEIEIERFLISLKDNLDGPDYRGVKRLYKNIFEYLGRTSKTRKRECISEAEVHATLVCGIRELFEHYKKDAEQSAIVAYCFTYGNNPDYVKDCLKKHRYFYKKIRDFDSAEWERILDFCASFALIFTPKMISDMVEAWNEDKWLEYKRYL